jgi:hypothetical protein
MATPPRAPTTRRRSQLPTAPAATEQGTGRLLPVQLARQGNRVVTVSSLNHHIGTISLEDLQSERAYSR